MTLPTRESPGWLAAMNPFTWVQRAVGSFSPANAPVMSRANHRRELIAAAFLPWVVAAIEGSVIGVIVDRFFEDRVSSAQLLIAVATLTAAPAFANITSFLFVRLSHGRHKVRSVNLLQVLIALLATVMAMAPRSLWGLVLVVVCTIGARMCMAGVVTIRSAVWRANYPKESRARLTGRVALVQMLMIAGVGLGITQSMELFGEQAFRVAVPIGAAVSLIGVRVWGRIRVRGHRALLEAERSAEGNGSTGPSFNPMGMFGVLRADHRYAAYMGLQFWIGVGNMMCMPPIISVTKDVFELGYGSAAIVTHAVPLFVMPLLIGVWAARLDRWHILKFRAVHTWAFVFMMVAFAAAVWFDQLWLLYVGAVFRGAAFAGGALAWNLGHNDFATDANASQYMAVHVTLTGVRGLIAPFLGVAMYIVLPLVHALAVWFLAHTEFGDTAFGEWLVALVGLESTRMVALVFVAGAVMLAMGAIGFLLLYRRMRPALEGESDAAS